MTLPERIVFQVTRMILATRTSRNLFAAYCVALHLLVFFMLYSGGASDGIVKQAVPLASAAGAVKAMKASDAWHVDEDPTVLG